MSIGRFVYYRAKSFVDKATLKKTIERNGISYQNLSNVSIDTINAMETIKNYKQDSNVLIDIGCYKGLFTRAANSFFDFEKSICFEPNVDLHETILNNNPGGKIKIESVALSDVEGKKTYFKHQDDSMNSIVEAQNDVLKSEFPWDNPAEIREQNVTVTTLDSYVLKNCNSKDKFFIKIDTQGNELNILRSAIETLKRTELCLIEFMFTTPYKSDFDFYDLTEFMKTNGFECRGALSIYKRPSMKISGVDFLFVKKA